MDSLIPTLYLKGVSSGDFSQALAAILGEQAAGLSATNVVRLKKVWEAEYREWTQRDLSGKRYVYFWADGLHVNVRLDEERSCILVIMGADEQGRKEVVAVSDGYRESKTAWCELLLDLRRRGLTKGPRLATADGALGFWAALREVYPGTEEQTCWFHKAGNVLDKMPQSVQGRAKTMIREMWQAPSLEHATSAYHQFCTAWEAKYPKAVASLHKDEGSLFSFYGFPAAHHRDRYRNEVRQRRFGDDYDRGERLHGGSHGDVFGAAIRRHYGNRHRGGYRQRRFGDGGDRGERLPGGPHRHVFGRRRQRRGRFRGAAKWRRVSDDRAPGKRLYHCPHGDVFRRRRPAAPRRSAPQRYDPNYFR